MWFNIRELLFLLQNKINYKRLFSLETLENLTFTVGQTWHMKRIKILSNKSTTFFVLNRSEF